MIALRWSVANESDLRTFPFDHDDVRIFIAAEIGTGDRYVRLHWQASDELEKHDRSASAITPAHVGTQNMEWDLVKGGNMVERVPLRHNVTGHYTAIEVQLRLTRRYGLPMEDHAARMDDRLHVVVDFW